MAKADETFDKSTQIYPIMQESQFIELERRMTAAGMGYRWVRYMDDSGEPWVMMSILGGREVRVDRTKVGRVLGSKFETWRGIPGYQAYFDTDQRVIHAEVKDSGFLSGDNWKKLGFEEVDGGARRLRVTSPDGRQVMSLATRRLDEELGLVLNYEDLKGYDHGYSFTVGPVSVDSGPDILEVMLRAANALFFEIDCRSGVLFTLRRSGLLVSSRERFGHVTPATFPKLEYDAEAIELYSYARDRAAGNIISPTPLASYLAYYQVLEYFMPIYSRAELLGHLKTLLKDPALDPDNDVHVSRLLGLTIEAGRDNSERSQLRATIERCLPEMVLRNYLEDRKDVYTAISDKDHIEHIRHVNEKDRTLSLSAQIADRVYDLRCRIVHTKDPVNTTKSRSLLPSSEEARKLDADTHLIKFLAQRIIAASGRSRPL